MMISKHIIVTVSVRKKNHSIYYLSTWLSVFQKISIALLITLCFTSPFFSHTVKHHSNVALIVLVIIFRMLCMGIVFTIKYIHEYYPWSSKIISYAWTKHLRQRSGALKKKESCFNVKISENNMKSYDVRWLPLSDRV